MPDFFRTPMGSTFYNQHVPKIAETLREIAKEMKRGNDLKEQELKQNRNIRAVDIAEAMKSMNAAEGEDEK